MSVAPMMLTGYTMKDQAMMATATGMVPPVEALLVAVVVCLEEAEASWCVTTVTKPGT